MSLALFVQVCHLHILLQFSWLFRHARSGIFAARTHLQDLSFKTASGACNHHIHSIDSLTSSTMVHSLLLGSGTTVWLTAQHRQIADNLNDGHAYTNSLCMVAAGWILPQKLQNSLISLMVDDAYAFIQHTNSCNFSDKSVETSHSSPRCWKFCLKISHSFRRYSALSFPRPANALTVSQPVKECNPTRPLQITSTELVSLLMFTYCTIPYMALGIRFLIKGTWSY